MAYEFIGMEEEIGRLAARHPHLHKDLHALRARLHGLKQSEAALTMRAAREPMLTEREPGPGMELPFPLGTVTLTKSTSGNISNNVQAIAYRIERFIGDEASSTGAPQLVTVDDIKLQNLSQNCASGSVLLTFYGPTVFQTPFKGMTLNQSAQALVSFSNLDGTNSRVVYAGFFGNAVR